MSRFYKKLFFFMFVLVFASPVQAIEKPEIVTKDDIVRVVAETAAQTPQRTPKIWEGDKLRPDVRKKILDYIDTFKNYFRQDYATFGTLGKSVIVGGIAGYNTTKYSDIDLHVYVHYDPAINLREQQALSMKMREEFKEKYPLEIEGFPAEIAPVPRLIELYKRHVESSDNVYNIIEQKWVNKQPGPWPELDQGKIIAEVIKHKKIILDALDKYSDYTSVDVCKNIHLAFVDLVTMRSRTWTPEGNEMNINNMVYKSLRNLGLSTQLLDARNECYAAQFTHLPEDYKKDAKKVLANELESKPADIKEAAGKKAQNYADQIIEEHIFLQSDSWHAICSEFTALINRLNVESLSKDAVSLTAIEILKKTGMVDMLYDSEKQCLTNQINIPIVHF